MTNQNSCDRDMEKNTFSRNSSNVLVNNKPSSTNTSSYNEINVGLSNLLKIRMVSV